MVCCAATSAEQPFRGWPAYGGGPASIRYSSLAQINRENAHSLRVAWTYDTGDAFKGSEMQRKRRLIGLLKYIAESRTVVL